MTINLRDFVPRALVVKQPYCTIVSFNLKTTALWPLTQYHLTSWLLSPYLPGTATLSFLPNLRIVNKT